MPRKKRPQFTKPATVAHPSLTPSSRNNQGNASGQNTSSVNDLIRHLRRSQISASPSERPQRENPQTVHPSLNAILDVPNTPAPRPRTGLRMVGGIRSRGPAGPPAPSSWVSSSEHTSNNHLTKQHRTDGRFLKTLGGVPGLRLPNEDSLLHLALKQLALDWESQKEYEQHYLATLSIRHKEALLSYISYHNPHAMDSRGIGVLFLDGLELENATGSEGLTHLDLSSSLGCGFEPRDLKKIFFKQPKAEVQASMDNIEDDIPESWDSPPPQMAALRTSISLSRFPCLTHLSISNPNGSYWKQLLGIAPHLATLTHLSLAYWPTPSSTPNSATAYRETPAGNVNYGGSNFYSAFDGDLSDAAGVLRRLSKATYCLQWLDLTGCVDWLQALTHEDGPDWCRPWRGVESVKMGQGWVPRCLKEQGSHWRQVVQATASRDDDVGFEAQKNELVAWAAIERDIIMTQDAVNFKRVFTEESCLGEGLPRSNSQHRYTRVEFDSGWEEFWIKDALEHVWAMTPKPGVARFL